MTGYRTNEEMFPKIIRKESPMKLTLQPGIRYEHRSMVPASKTVPALYPESEQFAQMPEVFATGFPSAFSNGPASKRSTRASTVRGVGLQQGGFSFTGGRPCRILPRTGAEINVRRMKTNDSGCFRFHCNSDTMRAMRQ